MPCTNFGGNLLYCLLTVAVLAIFYGIYFTKMLVQKRHGIHTRQLGRRKEKALHRVEILMSVATLAIVPIQLVSAFLGWSCLPSTVRIIGFFVGLTGNGIFLAAVLYMKDSWRAGIPEKDKTSLVTNGIYSFSRNPAFLGFDMMYIGVLLMYCNVLTGIFTAFCVVMLHLQILQEEKYMTATFGKTYLGYKKRVFRYIGRKVNHEK